MADVQIAVIDPEDTQLALAAPAEAVVNVAVPGVQGPIGLTGSVTIAQAGTAAEPGIRFESDTNTGIYSPGADQLAVSTGGTGRLFVDASGRVGIGTASPSHILDVRGTNDGATTYLNVANNSTTATSLAGIYFSGSGVPKHSITAATFGADYMAFNVGSAGVITERLRITSAGLVGIGIASPATKLHVVDPTAIDVEVRAGNSASYMSMLVDSTGVGKLVAPGGTMTFTTSASERARIDSSGRLLVGTSTARSSFYNAAATTELQVEGDGEFSVTRNANDVFGGSIILAKTRSSGNAVVSNGDVIGNVSFQGNDGSNFKEAATIKAEVDGTPGANDMPGRLVFSTTADGASSPTERMRIKSAGTINFSSVAVYADNAAAITGGLVAGDVYRTSTGQLMIRY